MSIVEQLKDPIRLDPLAVRQSIDRYWDEQKQDPVRLSTLNLVAVSPDQAEHAGMGEDLRELCEHYPARVFALYCDPSASGELEAWYSYGCRGEQLYQDQLTFYAPGEAVRGVPSLVATMSRPDLPVFLWWRGTPRYVDPIWTRLVDHADRIIVDSSRGPGLLEPLLRHVKDPYRQEQGFSDLEWARMARWRHLVAGLFDTPEAVEHLQRTVRVEMGWCPNPTGSRSAPLLLMGWLASRLGWTIERPLGEGEARYTNGIEFRLKEVEAPDILHGRLLYARLDIDKGRSYGVFRKVDHPQVYVTQVQGVHREHPDRDLFIPFAERQRLVAGELEVVGRQPLFEAALEGAVALGGGLA